MWAGRGGVGGRHKEPGFILAARPLRTLKREAAQSDACLGCGVEKEPRETRQRASARGQGGQARPGSDSRGGGSCWGRRVGCTHGASLASEETDQFGRPIRCTGEEADGRGVQKCGVLGVRAGEISWGVSSTEAAFGADTGQAWCWQW